jgi:hydroxymethylglutaryl-CoA lyase
MMESMSALEIVEVGPRDGLQNEDAVLDVAARVAYIEALAAAGLRRIEAVSFVHPARVPQMAGAEAVMAAVPRPDGVRYSGLVLNRRGMERAVAAGVDEINMVVVATDTFSAKNQGMTTAEAIRATAGIATAARDAGLRVTLTVGAAFGCPFEGEVRPERVTDIVRQCAEAGVNEIALADTIGVAVPRDVRTLAGAVRSVTDAPLRCHFHNTRNTGYANALAAIEAGVTALDASSGGIGGCPFAPAATGNIATEDLLYALDRSDIGTGIDMAALLAASAYVEQRLGHANPALLGRAGMFPALRSSLVRAAEPWRWCGAAERQCGPGLRHGAAGDPGRHVRPGRPARRGGPSRLIGGEPDPRSRGTAPARVRGPARDPAQQGRPGPHLDRRRAGRHFRPARAARGACGGAGRHAGDGRRHQRHERLGDPHGGRHR